MPEGIAITAVTTLGYAGILAGPALIGFAAHGIGLVGALIGVAVLMVAAAILYAVVEYVSAGHC